MGQSFHVHARVIAAFTACVFSANQETIAELVSFSKRAIPQDSVPHLPAGVTELSTPPRAVPSSETVSLPCASLYLVYLNYFIFYFLSNACILSHPLHLCLDSTDALFSCV